MLPSDIILVISFFGVAIGFDPTKHKHWKHVPEKECGINVSSRIVGGKEAAMNSFPWLANLVYKSNRMKNYVGCGGALINSNTVLTAAHCLVGLPPKTVLDYVRLGEHDLSTNPDCSSLNHCAPKVIEIKPDYVIHHSKYKTESKYDIALVKLKQEIKFTPYVSPICLPFGKAFEKNYEGKSVQAAGWGVDDLGSKVNSQKLQVVTLPIIKLSDCRKQIPANMYLGSGHLCAGGEGKKDTCEGDSGGPLMKAESTKHGPRYFILGVVSSGPKTCGLKGKPAINTNIVHYEKWILENLTGSELYEAQKLYFKDY